MAIKIATKKKKTVAPKATAIGEDGVAVATRIKEARAEQKRLKEQEDEDKETLRAMLKGATIGTFHGATIVTIKPQTRSGIDSKLLAEVYPEIFNATRTTSHFERIDIA